MPVDRYQNSTNYEHPQESNLLNIHKAMDYDADGKPVLRVDIGSDININGDVNIPGTVTVNSTPEDPVHTHVTEVGTSGVLSVPYMPIGGTVELSTSTLAALESISVRQEGTWTVSIGTNGQVVVSNFTSTVNIASLPAITGTVSINSLPAITGTVAVSNFPTSVTVTNFTSTVNIASLPAITGTVSVSNFTSTVFVSNTLTISNTSFAVTNFPTTSTVYQGTTPWTITGTVAIASLPEVEIKNDVGNPIPVTGNVTATITDVITVVVNDDAGALYAFNNHAAAVHRGWVMDDVMRPVISIRNGSASAADLIKIVEYEIGNNNANQSTIVYEWYEGPLTITGAAIPAWTTFGVHSQYRVYQDQYSSNQGNTFTVPAGTYMRHSGIIIGKNTSSDRNVADMHGGATDADKNMLTLCMKRVDNATELDVWFAFTIRELA